MIVGVICLGLALGLLLARIIAWQLRELQSASEVAWPAWLPLLGSVRRRNWLLLGVELATLGATVLLWRIYGFSPRFWIMLLAALVLIDTGAIDWQVKLIDTLVLLIATAGALLAAPLLSGSWLSSLLGALVAGALFLAFFVIARLLYPRQAAPFGLGDVYLGVFIGAVVGLVHLGAALLYGMLLAGLASLALILILGYRRARHVPIAYGAFLCLGTLLYLVIWPLP